MVRSRWSILGILAALTAVAAGPVADPAPASTPDGADGAVNSLKWALEMNSAKYGPPPNEFNRGSVSVSQLPPESVKRSEGRFEVQFPSHAPVITPAIYDGKVVVSGGFSDQALYAVDARTGAQIWGRHLDDDGPSAPACDGGVCVVNTESCTVFAVAANTGELLWAWWMGDPLLSSPTIADGVVYTSYPAMGTADGRPRPSEATHALAAMELRTGRILWQRWIDGDVMSAPVAVGGEVHLTTFAGSVWTFSAKDGAIKSVDRARATSAPTVVGGELFFSQRSEGDGEAAREVLVKADKDTRAVAFRANEKTSTYLDATTQSGSGYGAGGMSLDAGNGFGGGAPSTAGADAAMEIVGQGTVSRLQAHQGSRVVSVGTLGISTMGDEVVAIDERTGEQRWTMAVGGDLAGGGYLATTPAVAGDHLVVGTATGEVRVLDAKTGEVERTFAVNGPVRTQPLVHAGWIYVGTEDGRLVGLDTGDPTLTGWTQWGGNAQRTGAAPREKVEIEATRPEQVQ